MTDDNEQHRAEVARVFREHARNIEATAFEEASRLNQDIIAELVEIAARFSEVAEMLNDVRSSKDVMLPTPRGSADSSSDSNGAEH